MSFACVIHRKRKDSTDSEWHFHTLCARWPETICEALGKRASINFTGHPSHYTGRKPETGFCTEKAARAASMAEAMETLNMQVKTWWL